MSGALSVPVDKAKHKKRKKCCGGVIYRDPGGPEYPCDDCPKKPRLRFTFGKEVSCPNCRYRFRVG